LPVRRTSPSSTSRSTRLVIPDRELKARLARSVIRETPPARASCASTRSRRGSDRSPRRGRLPADARALRGLGAEPSTRRFRARLGRLGKPAGRSIRRSWGRALLAYAINLLSLRYLQVQGWRHDQRAGKWLIRFRLSWNRPSVSGMDGRKARSV